MSRIVETATLLLLSACLAACSGQSEATTREAQEREFRELLGFSPPEAIIEIQAADASHRGVVDAAYVRWLRFTYDPIVWDRAVRGRRSRVSADDRADPIRQDAIGQEIAPAWFREGHVEAVVELRVLGHEGHAGRRGLRLRGDPLARRALDLPLQAVLGLRSGATGGHEKGDPVSRAAFREKSREAAR